MKWEQIYIYTSERGSAEGETALEEKSGDVFLFKCGSFLFASPIKTAVNKPVTKWHISTTCHVPIAIVIFITENASARSLPSARYQHQRCAHTGLISCSHLYNNASVQSLWCCSGLEKWPMMPFVWNMVICNKSPLDVERYAPTYHIITANGMTEPIMFRWCHRMVTSMQHTYDHNDNEIIAFKTQGKWENRVK